MCNVELNGYFLFLILDSFDVSTLGERLLGLQVLEFYNFMTQNVAFPKNDLIYIHDDAS